MGRISSEDVKKWLAAGGTFLFDAVREAYAGLLNDAGARAFSDATEIGISNTIYALYDADVEDEKMIALLNKFWGICREEAIAHIAFEKCSLVQNELRTLLRLDGFSDSQIRSYALQTQAFTKIRENPQLWNLRKTPRKLKEALEQID